MQNAIITGASGYVGRHLAKKLITLGYQVHAIIRPGSDTSALLSESPDLTLHAYDNSYLSLENIFSYIKPSHVFHVAAQAYYGHSAATLDNLIDANIKFGSYLLEAMTKTGTINFINTGTYWQHLNSKEYNPVCLYAAQKQAFEAIIDYYVNAHSLNAITLKLFDVYGPNDPRPKLFNLFKKAAETGIPLDMSPGEQLVDFIYIDDVIEAYAQAADYLINQKTPEHARFFVGTGQATTLKNIVTLYNSLLGKTVPINWGKRPYREREVMRPTMGATLPGWKAKVNIETGIRQLLKS